MKRVLITGGAGFIGTHLVKSLLHRDVHSIVVDNLSNGSYPGYMDDNYYDRPRPMPKISFYKADIRDMDTMDKVFSRNDKIEVCIHLAAQISVIDSVRNPKKTTEVNVNGTENVIKLCSRYDVRNFVFASSAAVYGNKIRTPYSESDSGNPASPYGKSKLKGEDLVLAYSNSKSNNISLRFFNIYGRGQSQEYAGVITKFAQRLEEGLPPIIYGNGQQTRDFISVKDAIRAILIAAGINKNRRITSQTDSNVFNIGTGVPTRISDLANILINLFRTRRGGHNAISKEMKPLHSTPLTEADTQDSLADISRAKRILGFKYSVDLREGITNLYDTYLKKLGK